MAALPRLPAAVEHRFLKAACGLPPRLQRRIFGAPPQVDGQTLASDIHALLRIAELTRGERLSEGADVNETRAKRRHEAGIVGNRPPIPMERVEPLEIPGPGGPVAARLYAPERSQGPQPLLVYYHGGGWVIGDLVTADDPCRLLAAHSGVSLLSVDYRLAPEHRFPAAVEDAWAAYAWATANPDRLGADPDRIGVGGDSAGGNLAAAVCLLAREAEVPLPALQLLIYPVTEVGAETASRRTFSEGFLLTRRDMDYFEDRYLASEERWGDPRASPLRADDLSGLPPAYVATAGFDPLRDEGEAYALRMREAGVTVALRRHPSLIHSFANLNAICPSAREAMLEAAGGLRMGLG